MLLSEGGWQNSQEPTLAWELGMRSSFFSPVYFTALTKAVGMLPGLFMYVSSNELPKRFGSLYQFGFLPKF